MFLSSAKNVASITDHDQSKLDKTFKSCGYLIFTRPIFSNEGISEQVDSTKPVEQCWILSSSPFSSALWFYALQSHSDFRADTFYQTALFIISHLLTRKFHKTDSSVPLLFQIRIPMKFDGEFLLLSDATRPFTTKRLLKLYFVCDFDSWLAPWLLASPSRETAGNPSRNLFIKIGRNLSDFA